MKATLVIALSLSAFNLFAAELGEDKKSECSLTHQSQKREAKIVIEETVKQEKKEESKARSK